MKPETIIVTVILVILTMAVPRKWLLLPFVLAACFVPADQRIIIFGLDFTPLRILVMVGFMRTVLFSEKLTFKWNSFDKLVLAWAICGAIIYVIQWADMNALINKCGVLFDIVGLYCLYRVNLNSWEDIKFVIKIFAVCSLVLGVFVGLEWVTGKNPFALLGSAVTVVREGRYRCRASFPHAIMLGLFCATLVPFFVGFARQDKDKLLFWSAVGACVFIVAATSSSTPILTLLIVLILLCGYKWRRYTAPAGWIFLVSIITLHIVMRAPVWHLIARVGIIGGSTGWHRFNLINQGINHFGEWMFLGCKSTEHWGWGLSDITNQYILEGVRGGFITLVLFLIMIFMSLRILLRLSLQKQEYKQHFLIWCIFVSILGHCVSFLGVSYFGQMIMWWYMTLGMVGSLKGKERRKLLVMCQPLKHNKK